MKGSTKSEFKLRRVLVASQTLHFRLKNPPVAEIQESAVLRFKPLQETTFKILILPSFPGKCPVHQTIL